MKHQLFRSTILVVTTAVLSGAIFFHASRDGIAQSRDRTFVQLLTPFVGNEVMVSNRTGEQSSPATLREIGTDFLMLENRQKSTQAILIHSIVAVRLDEVPMIQLAY